MTELASLIAEFVHADGLSETDVYNEFSLQHELGIFLRSKLPGYKVQFERNVSHFAPTRRDFTKREIDIVVFSEDKADLKFAIELKFPRSGQHPEQMYSFCKDIAFAEELKSIGFTSAAVFIVVDHHLFYSGATDGIYGYFRGGRPITGTIDKPTGSLRETVTIKGAYPVTWSEAFPRVKFTLIEVA